MAACATSGPLDVPHFFADPLFPLFIIYVYVYVNNISHSMIVVIRYGDRDGDR